MPEVKFTHVVSCSSEEKQHPADNLLRQQSYRKWKCKPGENQATVILQLEKSVQLQSLDIGNEGSAFIEILGGRSSMTDDDYKVVLPTTGFMTPDESRKETNLNGVKFFDAEKFTAETRSEKWDRLKINCTQPFNKNLAFGLSFVKVHAVSSDEDKAKVQAFGKFKLKDDVDESADHDLAPGALFLARKNKKADEDKPSTSVATTSKPSTGKIKRESFWPTSNSAKRKSVDAKNGKAHDEKGTDSKKRKITTPPKKDHDQPSGSKAKPSSIEKKRKDSDEAAPKRQPAKVIPFDHLFDGVVFVLSGFQNPLRSDLRDQALKMGAKYQGDWGPGCTHLVCAFANTPKYNQVKGKGKIVKKEWILDSHKRRKRMNWKKYTFEEDASGTSDEEVVADDGKQTVVSKDKTGPSTAPERRNAKPNERPDKAGSSNVKAPAPSTKPKRASSGDPYDAPTDYSDAASDEDTDDEIERVMAAKRKAADRDSAPSTSTKAKAASPKKATDHRAKGGQGDLPQLPNFFNGMRFFLYGGFPEDERRRLNRFVVAFDGVVEQYMSEKVTHVLTHERWDESFDEALNDFPKIVFLRPEFVLACGKSERIVDMDLYKVERR